ncbi:DUF3895 domain-containing protein [Cohnella panacarvi]|uniref:DUF3895 domain-containing protein n=1 Tax=Cohnella panacarvi TaxID=400776 RepID=UPI00047E7660|nr:DUF3895 domain-containing protein [Cohnella panacarvi]
MILDVGVRDEWLAALPEEQRHFLSERLTRSRRTAFANAMAADKGFYVPEHAEPEEIERLLSDWIYAGYTDAGCVSTELRCECGRALRYQHRVEHQTTKETKRFGIEHLKEHLGIGAVVVSAIKKGFDAIDYELDEMLLKIHNGWEPNPDWAKLPNLPDDIAAHLQQGLPLLERQIQRLNALLAPKPRNAYPHPSATKSAARISEQEPIDLFTWNEPVAVFDPMEDAGPELPHSLQSPVDAYIQADVRSARVICELLIKDHGASSARFLTNKPHIYYAVCRYIESRFPELSVQPDRSEDRMYAKWGNLQRI